MRIFVVLALFSAYLPMQAQKVKVNWGDESKKEVEYRSLVKGNENEMIKLSFESSGSGIGSKRTVTPILTRYDDKLNEKGVRSFNTSESSVEFDQLLSVKGNLYIFTHKYNKADKTTTFYAQKIDAKTLNPQGKPVTLGSMSSIDRVRQSSGHYELSRDSSKILFFGLSPYSKKDNEKYYMAVYDHDMTKQWDNTVTLPYLDKYIDIWDYIVTNEGQVGIMLKHYDKEIKKEKVREDGANVPAYKAKFLLYEMGVAKPKEYILDLKDKYVHTITVTDDKQSNLTLFGLYKSKYDGYVSGYFLTALNLKDSKIDIRKMEAFPTDMVTLVEKDKQGSDNSRDPGISSNFRLKDVVQREDGSIDYLLEYYKMIWREYSNSNNRGIVTVTRRYPVYYYGDIIDINVKPNGKTGFVRIPKMQIVSHTAMYSSFRALTSKGKLFLFYNDDRDNIDRDLAKKPAEMTNFKKSVLAMAVIDAKGNLARSPVFDHKETKLTTCINVCQRINDDKLGLYAQKAVGVFSSAKDQLGVIELQ